MKILVQSPWCDVRLFPGLSIILAWVLPLGVEQLFAGGASHLHPDDTESSLTQFERNVLPGLTKAGCNSGRCHASLKTHGNFRLSPFGCRSTDDYVSIVDGPGQVLIDYEQPENSMLLKKATGAVKHEGGAAIAPGSLYYRLLLKWITAETPASRHKNPRPLRLEVSPAKIQMKLGAAVPLRVRSVEASGRTFDVTKFATFSVKPIVAVDGDVVTISDAGQVEAIRTGRCLVSIRYANRHAFVSVDVPFGKAVAQQEDSSTTWIDRLLMKEWQRMGLSAAGRCDDYRFMRRAYLRLTGRLPAPADVRQFASSKADDKRDQLIESLLKSSESDEYWAEQYLSLFSIAEDDLPPAKRATLVEWTRKSLRNNRSFLALVQDLLTAQGTEQSHGAIPFYGVHNTPEQFGEAAAELITGVNARCFRCHTAPYADWQPDDYHALSACFAGIVQKESHGSAGIYFDANRRLRHPDTAQFVEPAVLGVRLPVLPDQDPRLVLAELLKASSLRRRLARHLVAWHWRRLFSGSLAGEEDSLRDLADQVPLHAELLEKLTDDLIEHDFDVKYLQRMMCRSRMFELKSDGGTHRGVSRGYFHIRNLQRLSPSVLLHVLEQATEVPFDRHGREEIADYARYALGIGKQRGAASKCDRYAEQNFNLSQALHLINSNLLQRLITHPQGRVARLSASDMTNREVLEELMLCTVSRPPDQQAIDVVTKFAAEKKSEGWPRRQVFEDVMWALINTKEFLFVD